MSGLALFNNDKTLWENSREHYKSHGKQLWVISGHVGTREDGVLARFDGQSDACRTLESAGYVKDTTIDNGDAEVAIYLP